MLRRCASAFLGSRTALDDRRTRRYRAGVMAFVNENFLKLRAGYLFPEIARRVKEFAAANPTAPIIRMGIGARVRAGAL